MPADTVLLADAPVTSVDDYVKVGGGAGLERARTIGPDAVIAEVSASGLRGRGGAGFPTGTKWESVRGAGEATYVVCNAAEGEPGTFKDRWLMRRNPYQLLEGVAVAAFAVGAGRAYLGIKEAFRPEVESVLRALSEMRGRDLLGDVPIEVVTGPDEYLFGEETGLLEVIEGGPPLPRVRRPFMEGLFASPASQNPTAVNNVETLSNVPHILRNGAEWFRSLGTDASPGTMVFTLSGDVRFPGMYELPLGVTLGNLILDVGGGPPEGRGAKAVFPGAANTILTEEQFDTPLDFDSMAAVGSGLGSGGFVVYDDSACIVAVALAFSRFLYVESCAQCPPCKHGSREITEALERIEEGGGAEADLDLIQARARTVTDGQRCYLPTGESLIAQSVLQLFATELKEHLGRPCPSDRDIAVPKMADYDEDAGRFAYDDRYPSKRPDWTYPDDPRPAPD
ncbi:MAG: SLBB domain-containing protein [Actinomycetota bacterium]|nr:SLBB domain-containing protein [Actinomycetota bacterium]